MKAVKSPAITKKNKYSIASFFNAKRSKNKDNSFFLKYKIRAKVVPNIIIISNSAEALRSKKFWNKTKWAEEEIGNHSLNPCIVPKIKACNKSNFIHLNLAKLIKYFI